jgi:hypothetical protein
MRTALFLLAGFLLMAWLSRQDAERRGTLAPKF